MHKHYTGDQQVPNLPIQSDGDEQTAEGTSWPGAVEFGLRTVTDQAAGSVSAWLYPHNQRLSAHCPNCCKTFCSENHKLCLHWGSCFAAKETERPRQAAFVLRLIVSSKVYCDFQKNGYGGAITPGYGLFAFVVALVRSQLA